jgi:hypothetical protein
MRQLTATFSGQQNSGNNGQQGQTASQMPPPIQLLMSILASQQQQHKHHGRPTDNQLQQQSPQPSHAQHQFSPEIQQQLLQVGALIAAQGQSISPQMEQQLAASMMLSQGRQRSGNATSQYGMQHQTTTGSSQPGVAVGQLCTPQPHQLSAIFGARGNEAAGHSVNSSRNSQGLTSETNKEKMPSQSTNGQPQFMQQDQTPMNHNLQQMQVQLVQAQQQGLRAGTRTHLQAVNQLAQQSQSLMTQQNHDQQQQASQAGIHPPAGANAQPCQTMNQLRMMLQPQQQLQQLAAMLTAGGKGGQIPNFLQGGGNK